MQIKLVRSRCQGHARCATVAPELFDLDEEGYGLVRPGCEAIAHGDREILELAQLAVDNCPERAIRIETGAA